MTANKDFFVLITLAATIAMLGLLQNSTAVIIGAMLVAPLMSPIIATAMGIVEGDLRLIRVAAEATSKGIAMAIGVGITITLLSPEPPATTEIFGRTQPTLLDLAVALASGAAAGYSLSRKSVAAALPGVSIAVALVPPLCVVGYGIAISRLDIAGGSLLLFATNLTAIILAGAVMFLLLGFRPLAQYHEQFQRGLMVSVVSIIVIAIPLSILLGISMKRFSNQQAQEAFEEKIVEILEKSIPPDHAKIVDVTVTSTAGEHTVYATIYDYANFATDDMDWVKTVLNDQLDEPVNFKATVLKAQLTE